MSLKMKYFVLSPFSSDLEHGAASRAAMEAYANAIEPTQPNLAADVRTMIGFAHLDSVQKLAAKEVARSASVPE